MHYGGGDAWVYFLSRLRPVTLIDRVAGSDGGEVVSKGIQGGYPYVIHADSLDACWWAIYLYSYASIYLCAYMAI